MRLSGTYIHSRFPRTPLGQADNSHVNARCPGRGFHHTTGWVSLIPIDRHFRQLQLPERLHHRVAHARVRVIEPRNEGGAVLRERRRLQLSGRLHRRLANVLVRVLEPRNEGGGAVQPQLQYEAVVIERAVMLVCYGAGASSCSCSTAPAPSGSSPARRRSCPARRRSYMRKRRGRRAMSGEPGG